MISYLWNLLLVLSSGEFRMATKAHVRWKPQYFSIHKIDSKCRRFRTEIRNTQKFINRLTPFLSSDDSAAGLWCS